jgi:AcrR family transcriptional regulator
MAAYPEQSERTSDVTSSIIRLLGRGGIAAVTMRNIARENGMSVGTLTGHLTTRERMLFVCAKDLGRRRLRELDLAISRDGLSAFLPATEGAVLMTRAWLAWREWARNLDGVAVAVAWFEAEERARLRDVANPPDEASLDALMAMVHGLRSGLCAREGHRLEPVRAQAALDAAASALARSSATILSGSSAE